MTNRPEFKAHDDFIFEHKEVGKVTREEFIKYIRNSHDHMRKLSEIIQQYNQTIDDYLNEWDGKFESFDEDVKDLLHLWIQDGTMDTIINENLMSIKADKEYVDDLNENVTAQLAQIATKTYVSVTDFGAKGDGVTDDTNAIIKALEYANGLPTGTWETGGDTTANKRKRMSVYFPVGEYRTTRTIPIHFSGVSIFGQTNDSEGSMDWVGYGSTILADHSEDVFAVNSSYYSHYVSFKNLGFRKTSTYTGQGHAISVTGTEWYTGLSCSGLSIRGCNNAIHLATDSVTIGNVWVDKCDISNNIGYGFYSSDHITIGRIERSNITQQVTGGIYTAGKGISIRNNNLEGQPNPLIINGTNNENITIAENYFEYHYEGDACITVNLCQGLSIKNNQFTVNVEIPLVHLTNCSKGEVDVAPILRDCSNIQTPSGYALPSTGDFGFTINLSKLQVPVYGVDTMPNIKTFGGVGATALIGHRRYKTNLIDNNYRNLYTLPDFTFTTGDYVMFAFVIKYTDTLPTTNNVLVYGRNTENEEYEHLTTVGYDGNKSTNINDSILYTGGMKISDANSYDSLRLYIYPYTSGATVGYGAHVSKIIAFKTTESQINKFNPLSILEEYVYDTRPTNPKNGESIFDSVLGKPIWWDGTAWKDSDGTTV